MRTKLSIYRRQGGRITGITVLFLVIFVAAGFAQKAPPQGKTVGADPTIEATSVLLDQAKGLLKENRLEEVIPFLEEILIRLEGSEDQKAQQTRSFTMYQLGVCQMQMENYEKAAGSFADFIEIFPEDSSAPLAKLLLAESLAMLQKWPDVATHAAELLASEKVEQKHLLTVNQLLAEALYRQQKWKEAVLPLSEV
ncbi:MAG: tetratricopeptide repeat protein, partial [Kiritimatiellales bacterium]|nr:tetratricopeptide repeat protein [Kiritimatiellales bacterium]